jgi:hypothetical protein
MIMLYCNLYSRFRNPTGIAAAPVTVDLNRCSTWLRNFSAKFPRFQMLTEHGLSHLVNRENSGYDASY